MSSTIHLLDTTPLGKLPKNYEQASEFQSKLGDMPSETPSAHIVAFAQAITDKWPLTADIDVDADEAPEVVWSPEAETMLAALRNNEIHAVTLGWTTGFEPPYQKEAAMLDMIETALAHKLTVLDHQLCHAYFPNGKASPREAGTYLKTMRAFIGDAEPENVITLSACVRLIRNQLDPIMKEHGFEYFEGKFKDTMEWRRTFENGGMSIFSQLMKENLFFNKYGKDSYVTIPVFELFIDSFDNQLKKDFFGIEHDNRPPFVERRSRTISFYPLEFSSEESSFRKRHYTKKLYINVELEEGREELNRVMQLFIPWAVKLTSIKKLVYEITEGKAEYRLQEMRFDSSFLLMLSMSQHVLFEEYAQLKIQDYEEAMTTDSVLLDNPEKAQKTLQRIKDEVERAREVGQKYYNKHNS